MGSLEAFLYDIKKAFANMNDNWIRSLKCNYLSDTF